MHNSTPIPPYDRVPVRAHNSSCKVPLGQAVFSFSLELAPAPGSAEQIELGLTLRAVCAQLCTCITCCGGCQPKIPRC